MKLNVKAELLSEKLILKSIDKNEIETIRIWKNEHKQYFFYQKDISEVEQLSWFDKFELNINDHMFIINDDKTPVGCIGARLINNYVDIYNVILGNKEYKGKHLMKNALWSVVTLFRYIYKTDNFQVSVLKNNPAIMWYEKIGFYKTEEFEDYIILKFNPNIINEKYNFKIDINLPYLKY